MKAIKTIAIFVAMAMTSCGHGHDHSHEHDHGHHADETEHADDHDEGDEHDHAHNAGVIKLNPQMAQLMGVEAQAAEPGAFRQSIKVSGQIVDNPSSASVVASPTAGIVSFATGIEQGKDVSKGTLIATLSASGVSGGDANQVARLAMEAAKRELDRVEPLYADGIVSAKDYYAAKQAYEQAAAAYSSTAASGRAVAPSPGVVTQLLVPQGSFVDPGTPIASISSSKSLSLRADLPDRYYSQAPSFVSANLVLPDGTTICLDDLSGKRTGGASSSQTGYVPLYFSFSNDGRVAPGSFVTVYLLGSVRNDVLSVPVGAISEQQGSYFVYEQLDDDCYKKVPVTLGMSDGSRVEVLSGIEPGQNIVMSGAAAVRLAETATVAPEGHSHHH